MLPHISSLRLPSGHSGPVLTLSNAARTSLFSPRLLVADMSIWATSLGVAVMRILCGFYLFFPPGYVAFGDSKTPHRPADERVSWCLETSPPLRLLPQKRVSIPNSFVSLFIFYILSYLLSKTMGCLSGCLVSSASVQKLCCGICSAFKLSFDEFVGEKVVSLSYYSTILGLHLIYFILNRCHHFCMHYCDDFPLSLTLNQSYL